MWYEWGNELVCCSYWNVGLEYVGAVFRVIIISCATWAFHYVRLAFLTPVCISTCSEEPVELWLNKEPFSYLSFVLFFHLNDTYFKLFVRGKKEIFHSHSLFKEKQDWSQYNCIWQNNFTGIYCAYVFTLWHLSFFFLNKIYYASNVSWFSAAPLHSYLLIFDSASSAFNNEWPWFISLFHNVTLWTCSVSQSQS